MILVIKILENLEKKLERIGEINSHIEKSHNSLEDGYQDIKFIKRGKKFIPKSLGSTTDINRLKEITIDDYPFYPKEFTDEEIRTITEKYNTKYPEKKKTYDYIKFHLDKLYLNKNENQITHKYIQNRQAKKIDKLFFL